MTLTIKPLRRHLLTVPDALLAVAAGRAHAAGRASGKINRFAARARSFRKQLTLVLAASVILSASMGGSAAAGAGTGHILHMGIYGDGGLYVILDSPVNEPGCPGTNRFDIPPGHPQLKNWTALATMAYATRSVVTAHTTGCYAMPVLAPYPAYTSPTIDQSEGGWFTATQ